MKCVAALTLVWVCLAFFADRCPAQQKVQQVEIIRAGSLEGTRQNGVEVRRLIGDVAFKQDQTYLYCDSALFFETENIIDAYGSVRIEGPKAKLIGDFLHYKGNEQQALITGKAVRLFDDKMVLTTTELNYNLKDDIGEYNSGGTVVDSANELTSRRGKYEAAIKTISFRDQVVLKNKKYIIHSDTMRYVTSQSLVIFPGPVTINGTDKDSSQIYCEYGWYHTKSGQSYFSKNAYVRSRESILRGDSLLYNRNTGTGNAYRNVSITDTVNKVIVNGDYAFVSESKGQTLVTGHTLLTRIFDNDSLFLHGDTLKGLRDTITGHKMFNAFHHVRIFKTDLQGQCDSLVYSTADSSVRFFKVPVLWNNKNQLTADSIRLLIAANQIQTMHLNGNAFIVSSEDSIRYNQVKGRNMTGYFTDNKLHTVRVVGNGQTIYYIRNGKKQLTGVNRADCSDLVIRIDSNTVKKITLINKPDATLYPVKELSPAELKLSNFKWLGPIQPKTKEDIFLWPEFISSR